MDATALAAAIIARELSAREACEAALAKAEADELGSFWALCPERALARAGAIDALLRRGEDAGPLAGVPVAAKDLFDVAGLQTWSGVRWEPPPTAADEDAAAVSLLEAAGAVVVGKTAMHQLAWSMSGEAPGFPQNRNAADPERMPGGSSGGSATAVAAGIVPLALGTDTGGSVRQPAAWNGVVGFKPTLGTIDPAGCAPLSRSLDTVGLLTRSARDATLGFRALNGTTHAPEVPRAPRIGVVESLFAGEPGVEQACRAALGRCEAAGATLGSAELPSLRGVLAPIYAAELADVWGERCDAQPTETLLPDTRDGIARGRQVLAVDYLAAHWALRRLRREAAAAMQVDILACPTTPIVAPLLGDPDPTSKSGRNTRVFNALGWPAISIPCGEAGGHPVGLMLAAPPARDAELLAIAERLEPALSGKHHHAP
jgi:aspartyl-tRNA(Asn)/glutamyl-tRNA(Gln) amidotransferase subunit A